MFSSTALEAAIGMALIYLLLSLFCTAINEAIAGFLGSRAKNLKKGIESLFTQGLNSTGAKTTDGKASAALTLTDAIYTHGLIQSLYRSGSGNAAYTNPSTLPSYIPSRVFASALLDIVFPDDKNNPSGLPTNLTQMLERLKSLPESKGKEAIITLVIQANGDLVKTRQAFEQWFDDGMDRAAGWYKRKTQFVLFGLGLTLAVGLNIDSIAVGRILWSTPVLRSYSVASAEGYAKKHLMADSRTVAHNPGPTSPADPLTDPAPNGSQDANIDSYDPSADLSMLQSLSLPIGWSREGASWLYKSWSDPWRWVAMLFAIIGWLLTGIAVTLGAPFWFDTLNQFMVIRSTIKPREKSEVEGSKD
jgi:hypothetical protein